MFENTATYFGELLMQEGAKGLKNGSDYHFFVYVLTDNNAQKLHVYFVDDR